MAEKTPPYTAAYRKIGRECAQFAEMIASFERMGSAEFLKHYPDYDYDGTDYICRRAEQLAATLNTYASEQLSGQGRAARATQVPA